MKRLVVLFLSVLAPCSAVWLNAQNTSSSSAIAEGAQVLPAIVTVTFNAVVLQTNEARVELNRLQGQFASRESHLKDLSDEIETQRKQLASAADKLSDEEKSSRAKVIESKDKQLQRDAEDLRNDSQAESQQVFQKVAQKVYTFLQDYAQKRGYTFVLERGSVEAPVVWYAVKSSDITDAVVQAYNAKSGIAAPAPPAKSK